MILAHHEFHEEQWYGSAYQKSEIWNQESTCNVELHCELEVKRRVGRFGVWSGEENRYGAAYQKSEIWN